MGRLAAPFSDDSLPWQRTVEPICEYAEGRSIPKKEMLRLYASFLPAMKTWSSNVGEIPEMFIKRRESTMKMLACTPRSSVLYGYRKWAADIAEKEYQEAADEAEAEKHE